MIKKVMMGMLISTAAIAEIISVPVTNTVPIESQKKVYGTPTRTCVLHEVAIPNNSPNWIGGTIGALVGHAASRATTGSNVTRVLATVAGAALGGHLEDEFNNATNTNMVNDCTITRNPRYEKYIAGYNVYYNVDGVEHSIFMNSDPGQTIQIQQWTLHKVVQ